MIIVETDIYFYNMKKILLSLSLLLLALPCWVSAQTYRDPNAPIEERVEDALGRMTLDEKIAIIHAQSKFSSPGVARLGIPGNWCTDGPHGIRAEVLWDEWNTAGWTNDSVVAFPALTCLSATWNPEMSALYGKAIGEEALYRGKNVLLGPGVNIYRTPLNGRNFEYMGEDPYLSGRMVIPYIEEVQRQGVATCVKHFALNSQEDNRHHVNVTVDDRALYELYLPAFKSAVTEAGTWSIMGAYNRYKGQFACHNHTLLVDILRKEWGFDGAVISDWGGCLNTDEAIHNGLDLEFGSWTNGLTEGASNAYDMYYLAEPYKKLIKEGKVGTEELDQKVRNVLRMIFRTSMNSKRGFGALCSEEHYAAARQIAGEGMVLLKNEASLPLSLSPKGEREGVKTILVVGENAIKPMTIGGGSSSLKVQREVSPLEGIRRRAGKEAEVLYARGYVGAPITIQDGMVGVDLSDNRSAEAMRHEAVEKAKEADVVIFVGGLNKEGHQDCEGVDRKEYGLPYGQNELIEALAAANPKTVVVLVSGNAVAMPWMPRVAGVVEAWYSGSETGNALADVLFGDVNPSGRMPFTVLAELSDYPAHQFGEATYPGVNNEEEYTESFYVGYRYTDLKKAVKVVGGKKLQPLKKGHLTVPFGFGLSYTTFAYANARVEGNKVLVDVTNTGKVAGKEVVQVYAAPVKSKVEKPVKQLCGFAKVMLQPGETKTVEVKIGDNGFRHFDPASHAWVSDSGKYELLVARNARDIEAKLNYEVK